MTEQGVRVRVEDAVAVVELDRPSRRNALDGSMAEALARAFDHVEADDDVEVAVLAAVGDVFCAGADLAHLHAGDRAGTGVRDRWGLAGFTERPRTKPVVAAVAGDAWGGGLELALACDMVVLAEDARVGLPEVRWGLFAAGGGALRLPARVPHAIAMEWLLTGEPVPAAEALRWGLVNRLVPRAAVLTEAVALARRVLPGARGARHLTLQIAGSLLPDGAWRLNTVLRTEALVGEEAAEGAAAFVERRPPRWAAVR